MRRSVHGRPAPWAGGLAMWMAMAAWAGDGVGPQGVIGPSGPVGVPGKPAAAARQAVPTAPVAAPGAGNHIEVTGNQADGVACGDASVNSVDVRGARLEGRTVIVQGRNARGATARDCAGAGSPARGPAPGAGTTVNNIRIR